MAETKTTHFLFLCTQIHSVIECPVPGRALWPGNIYDRAHSQRHSLPSLWDRGGNFSIVFAFTQDITCNCIVRQRNLLEADNIQKGFTSLHNKKWLLGLFLFLTATFLLLTLRLLGLLWHWYFMPEWYRLLIDTLGPCKDWESKGNHDSRVLI